MKILIAMVKHYLFHKKMLKILSVSNIMKNTEHTSESVRGIADFQLFI